jgi:excisionase family DNA binding protein
MDRLLLTVKEAADILGVSVSTCYKLIAHEEIPSVQIGRRIRVPEKELRECITQRIKGGRL